MSMLKYCMDLRSLLILNLEMDKLDRKQFISSWLEAMIVKWLVKIVWNRLMEKFSSSSMNMPLWSNQIMNTFSLSSSLWRFNMLILMMEKQAVIGKTLTIISVHALSWKKSFCILKVVVILQFILISNSASKSKSSSKNRLSFPPSINWDH